MSSLDNKLREIMAKGYAYTLVNENKGQEINVAVKTEITVDLDAIKQAFADEGWDKYPSRTVFGTPLMTGQEWYERFKSIMDDLDYDSKDEMHRGVYRNSSVLLAARRAAKLEAGL